ncbi:hypothetical protein BGZ58_001153 [Dissophora ornata]|nr:hypothetical protein BGZ58_001153 [Dissophora ornata]
MPKTNILDYPELCHVLATYLSSHDLASCLLVCKSLYGTFLPYLYNTVAVQNYRQYLGDVEVTSVGSAIIITTSTTSTTTKASVPQTSPPFASLRSNGHLIENLSLIFNERLGYANDPQAPGAWLLETYGPEALARSLPGEAQKGILVRVLRYCINLKSLTINGLHPAIPPRPHLLGNEQILMAQEICELERDNRDLAIARLLEEVVATVVNSDDERATTKGIQELYLSNLSGFSRQCIQVIYDTTLSTTLQVLDIQSCAYFQSEEMHLLLSMLPNLKYADLRCRDKTCALEPYAGISSKKNRVHAPSEDNHNVHSETLSTTTRAISDLNATFPWPCQKSLKTLRIAATNVREPGPLYPTNVAYLWSLGSEFYSRDSDPQTPMVHKPCPEALHWFYDQIATLTRLRELCLVSAVPQHHRSRSLELTLEAGLARWETLKELEVLDVDGLDHNIGLNDMKWMVANWPALREIRGLIHKNDKVLAEPALWLMGARPDIKLPMSTTPRRLKIE